HRRDMVRTRYGAQMHFHFLELDPVAEDFYLIVDAAEVMEHAALVLHPEVARQVPPLAVDRRKARRGAFRLLDVTGGQLRTGQRGLGGLAGRDRPKPLVHDHRLYSRIRHADGDYLA